MSFLLSNESIDNQIRSNNFFANAIDLASFINDRFVFSSDTNSPNILRKHQWMQYCRIIMPYSGYTVKYDQPFKSESLKNVTDYEIYYGDKFITGERTSSLENAEAQAYIKISQRSSFKTYYNENIDKVKWLIDKCEGFRVITDLNCRYYRLGRDLDSCLKNKSLVRQLKLLNLIPDDKI